MSKNMLGILLREARGPVGDLLGKLCGNDGREWLYALKIFLRKENPWNIYDWSVWKTIKLSNDLKTIDDISYALQNGFVVLVTTEQDNSRAKLRTVELGPDFEAGESAEIDLVMVTVGELGLRTGATYPQIKSRAKRLGLELCPQKVGPLLRLQYKNQSPGEWFLVASDPVITQDGVPRLFSVWRGSVGDLYLGITEDCSPEVVLEPHTVFVFVYPRK